jgi:hypothetical protein
MQERQKLVVILIIQFDILCTEIFFQFWYSGNQQIPTNTSSGDASLLRSLWRGTRLASVDVAVHAATVFSRGGLGEGCPTRSSGDGKLL